MVRGTPRKKGTGGKAVETDPEEARQANIGKGPGPGGPPSGPPVAGAPNAGNKKDISPR